MKKITLLSLLVFFSNAYAAEDSIYDFNWLDDDETVYVIQNKEYPTSNKFEIDFQVSDSDSSPYQTSLGFTAGLTYYLSEVYSVDLMYKTYANSNSNDLDSLQTNNNVKPLIRKIDASAFLHFNWLPFYGKINTLNKIFYFYWGIGAGLGQFQTQANWDTFTNKSVPLTFNKKEDIIGYNAKTFIKFFLAKNWNFGVEVDIYMLNAINDPDGVSKGMLVFNDTSLTFGYIF